MDEHQGKLEAFIRREPVASIMLVIAVLLVGAFFLASNVAARTHRVDMMEAVLIATMVFAVAGVVFGLARNLRRKRSPTA